MLSRIERLEKILEDTQLERDALYDEQARTPYWRVFTHINLWLDISNKERDVRYCLREMALERMRNP